MIEKVVEASQRVASAPSPSKRSMDDYRVISGCESGRSRAANGESLSLYGKKGAPVPTHLATICAEDFEPVAQAIEEWLMDHFLELVGDPFRSVLSKIPIVGKRVKSTGPTTVVDASVISALARAFMVMIAILCLTAAIFTLEVVKRPKVRILVVALFAQAFALPIQFLGSHSLPLYTLITS